MAVRIRLTRLGRKKRPFYRIVAVDSKQRRDGAYLDKIGHYNPITHPPELVIDADKAIEWMNKGALPSDTVRNLFSKQGIMMRFDLLKKGASPEKIDEEMKKRELLLKAKLEETKKEKAVKVEKPAEVETEPEKAAPEEKPVEAESAPKEEKKSPRKKEVKAEVKAETEEKAEVAEEKAEETPAEKSESEKEQ